MDLFLHQVFAGLSTGGIYALMALAIVMIYQAIDHLNFAQGEMAMFSTFVSWQMLQWGVPYWAAFLLTIVISFAGGVVIERVVFKPLKAVPVLSHVVVFIALFAILNSAAGFLWDYTIKSYPTPFGTTPLFCGLISSHDAGMTVVTLAIATLPPIFPSVRSLPRSSTRPAEICADVPSQNVAFCQRLASSGARSVTDVTARCG